MIWICLWLYLAGLIITDLYVDELGPKESLRYKWAILFWFILIPAFYIWGWYKALRWHFGR